MFVLASQSPRRKEILSAMGYDFVVRPGNFDERSVPEGSDPIEYVVEVARGKMLAALDQAEKGDVVLSSDLTVWHNNTHLHKPVDNTEAESHMQALSNTWHTEYGATFVGNSAENLHHVVSQVRVWLDPLTPDEMEAYLAIADATDKAGGFDLRCYVQVKGRQHVQFEGYVTTILGLDAIAAENLLQRFEVLPGRSGQEVEADFFKAVFGEDSREPSQRIKA